MSSYHLDIRHEVQLDILEAMEWHEDQMSGLGADLENEINLTIQRIVTGPMLFPLVYKTCRRALTNRFSYAVYFRMRDQHTIRVLAVMHTSRDFRRIKARLTRG